MKQQEPLGPQPKLKLLDEAGQPLSERIHAVFLPLETRFRLKFKAIDDEAVVRNLFDQAAQIYAKRDAGQTIDKPQGFAWKVLCNLATSILRRSEEMVINGSIDGLSGERVLVELSAVSGTPDQIVNQVYAREIFEQLSEIEQRCATLKTLGFSSSSVAQALNMTAGSVDKTMQRIRDRHRPRSVDVQKPDRGGSSS
jgi:hypothetical protein